MKIYVTEGRWDQQLKVLGDYEEGIHVENF